MSAQEISVLHVLHSLGVGGTENGVVNLAGALRGRFRHGVVTMTDEHTLARRLPPGVPVTSVSKRPGLDVRAVVRLVSLFRRVRPTIVHTRNWGALDAVVAARLAGVPVVIHGEHGREASDPLGLDARRRRGRRMIAPLVNRFVAVSRDLSRWLVETIGIRPERVVTIPNGVDTEKFGPGARATARERLGWAPDVVVFGTVGRLDPVKDQLGLLEAFALLRLDPKLTRLVVVGGGPCRAALEARAAAPDLADRVELLGERSDVPHVLSALDVFVLPSLAEGISNTILEAMASGLPVVATDVAGNAELVEHDATGRLVPVGDRPALARALESYRERPALRDAHGAAARRRAVEAFSLARMAERYGEVYAQVAATRGKAA